MNSVKYVGMDVHSDIITVAVKDREGELLMESTVPTRANTLLEFFGSMKGTVQVAFEEGTQSAWLYGLLVRRVAKVVVCDTRKTALLKSGSKNDRIDPRKLADLLRNNSLSAVYHGEGAAVELQHRVRSYQTLTEDTTRVMARLKAVFRGRAICCGGKKVYSRKHREAYLKQLDSESLRHRAECLYQELDALQPLRRQVRRELISGCRKQPAAPWLQSIPFLGPIRVAQLIARLQTPHRFRGKRQIWGYCGFGLDTGVSGEYRVRDGQVQRKKPQPRIRGLNWNHNHELKAVFKGAATTASTRPGVFRDFYLARISQGMKPEMARLTLARKMAAIALAIWKKGERFDPQHLKPSAA